jgi:hypothetical protein
VLRLDKARPGDAGHYAVSVTAGGAVEDSDVALLEVRPKPRAERRVLLPLLLVLGALGSAAAAGLLWFDPETSCTATAVVSAPSSSVKTTARSTSRIGPAEQPARERTSERVAERRQTPATAAAVRGCGERSFAAASVTLVEKRDPGGSKEVVLALVGLAAVLGLAGAFSQRISKLTFPGGGIELSEVARKASEAVGDASAAIAELSSAVEGLEEEIEIEQRRRALIDKKLELIDADLMDVHAELDRLRDVPPASHHEG